VCGALQQSPPLEADQAGLLQPAWGTPNLCAWFQLVASARHGDAGGPSSGPSPLLDDPRRSANHQAPRRTPGTPTGSQTLGTDGDPYLGSRLCRSTLAGACTALPGALHCALAKGLQLASRRWTLAQSLAMYPRQALCGPSFDL
jgi:hypothetical protein